MISTLNPEGLEASCPRISFFSQLFVGEAVRTTIGWWKYDGIVVRPTVVRSK